MNSDLNGFRVTLLEPDIARFKEVMRTIAGSITHYLQS
jgi:hypothetical protein